jgi:hypothetical protein
MNPGVYGGKLLNKALDQEGKLMRTWNEAD